MNYDPRIYPVAIGASMTLILDYSVGVPMPGGYFSMAITNVGSNPITDLRVDLCVTDIVGCPWIPYMGTPVGGTSDFGVASGTSTTKTSNVAFASNGLPVIAAGASALLVFRYFHCSGIRLYALANSGNTSANVFARG